MFRQQDIAIWEAAKKYLDVRDNDEHTLHSYVIGQNLLAHENGADPDIILPAIILHDIGWKMIPADKVLLAFGPNKKYPELQRQHELEGVQIATEILDNLGFSEDKIVQIIDIIDGHDTTKEQRSLNDAIMKDADKLWRYTEHGIGIISGWFEISRAEFLKILKDFVRPMILRSNSKLLADSMLDIAELKETVMEMIE